MQTLHDYGYAIWCQRNQCYRCKDTNCECLHHEKNGGTAADPEILAICIENAVARGSLAYRCQMGQHNRCKKNRCNCKCHLAGVEGATVVVKEKAPIAS